MLDRSTASGRSRPGRQLAASRSSLVQRSTRRTKESSFGYDFGGVRVHAEAQTTEAARAVDALAFAVGDDVVFRADRWAPMTLAGRGLLAHELARVVQQDGAGLTAARDRRPPLRESAIVARQPADVETRARPLVLTPTLPGVTKILEEREAASPRPESLTHEPRCETAVREQPPWMPNVPRRSPIDLGEGTRRHPKLKAPDRLGEAQCRGACGPDCPNTCKNVGTYRESYEVGACGYVVEFPNALMCGTHAGCRSHDACFDTAVANGERYPFGPRHNQCNQDAVLRWGPANTKSWMTGGGPYDDWWYFVDDPIVRSSWLVGGAKGPSSTP